VNNWIDEKLLPHWGLAKRMKEAGV